MGLFGLLVVAAALLQATVVQSCGAACPENKTYFLKHYEELGCMPTYDKTTSCPTVYNCSTAMTRPTGKCRYNKVDYTIGQPLAANSGLPCKSCYCSNTTMGMGFQCATQRCKKWRLPRDCVELFEFNSCCSTNIKCKTNTTEQPPPFTCKLANQTYFEGQMMPSNHPCKSCLCQKGFDGTLNGAWCRSNSCGLELDYHVTFSRGCVPIYSKDTVTCCPLRWRCPSTKDYVIPMTPTTTVKLMDPMVTSTPMVSMTPTTTVKPMVSMVTSTPMVSMTPTTTVKLMDPMVTSTPMVSMTPTTTVKPMVSMVTSTPMDPMTTTKLGSRRRRNAGYEWDNKVTTPSPTVAPVTLPANATSTPMCTFGSLRLKVADKLSSTSKCVECSCTVPPYVTCLQDPRCSPWG